MTKIEESIHSTTVEMESSRLMKLPFETLEAIFSHVDPEDLVSLCLVSRSVREHAASRLYRSLECILQPKSDLEHKWPIDRLAKELETLTTSDFNYAAYIKSIYLDTAPLTDDNDYQFQEQIADQFKYDTPCGKFFNNLLLASIKRISTLESFRWNAGLELNPAVFAALAKIPSLQHICIRMPAGVEPIQKKSTPAPPPGPPTQPLPLPVQLNQIHMHSAPPMASVNHLSHNSTGCQTSSVQDEEELYQPLPPPPPGQPAAFTSSSSRNSEVRRERLAQEQVLARLFSLEIDKNSMSQKESNELVDNAITGTTKGLQVRDDADLSLINDLKSVLEKLNTQQPKYQAVIAEIEKVTGPYQDSEKEPGNETQQGEQSTAPAAVSSGEKDGDNAVAADGNKESKEHEPKSGDTDTLVTGDAEDMDLEKRLQTLVDMEHPDDISEGEDQEFVDEMIDTAPRLKAMTNGTVHFGKSKGKGPANKIPADNDDHSINEHDVIHNYVRQHHGIALDSLSIYLVPVKPSILCRGINVWTLRHISLLNVGPQRALWATLENLNRYNPIPLLSVHTDNVTSNLLSFLGGLQRLEELFMIERSTRSRVEPSTPKPTVTVEGMRNLVLAKHIGTLKRLMIRNDNDLSWSLDPASVLLMARNGHKLIELVAHLGSRCFHLLMRHMSTMESLSVLHVLFSDPDYCVSVLDEVRESAIDNFAHYSSVKDVYIGVSYASGGPVQTRCTFMRFRNRNSLTTKEGRTFDSNDNDAADIVEDFINTDPSTCVILSEVAHFEDTPGVKVWKKENWNLML
ncbi:uncharacterized protein TERG_07414 [Trichophyton rubrum CBS 118892]|uniref:F-box domain-containing protein n=1 Tax=Trichophyton rubrum (strain ATCC MYA-4607 / CBS 118892) TaxID=559305 RepID=F2SXV6_TRIRC|nr:uncharacterized protein TERG_07414 [Trichophyton rubrum CBS 118892]EGD91193.2 hypothetical protein TERG_07414 [Trichophyton rubrum CBS 118892]